MQVLSLEEPQVRRNLVAGLEEHDVPRDELIRGKHPRLAPADGSGLGGKHVADRIQRLLGPALLDEPKSPFRTTTAKMIAASTQRLSISLVNPAPKRT